MRTDREVDVLGLAWREGVWHLAAFCHRRKAFRLFRLDRVLRVRVLRTRPAGDTPRPASTPGSSPPRASSTRPRSRPVRVTVRLRPPFARVAPALFPSALRDAAPPGRCSATCAPPSSPSWPGWSCHSAKGSIRHPEAAHALPDCRQPRAELAVPRTVSYTARAHALDGQSGDGGRGATPQARDLARARTAPVTREQIYEAFPDDYAGQGEAREKKWTRDKQDLKRLGIPLVFEEERARGRLPRRARLLHPPPARLRRPTRPRCSGPPGRRRCAPTTTRSPRTWRRRSASSSSGAKGLPPRAALLEADWAVPEPVGAAEVARDARRRVERRKRVRIGYRKTDGIGHRAARRRLRLRLAARPLDPRRPLPPARTASACSTSTGCGPWRSPRPGPGGPTTRSPRTSTSGPGRARRPGTTSCTSPARRWCGSADPSRRWRRSSCPAPRFSREPDDARVARLEVRNLRGPGAAGARLGSGGRAARAGRGARDGAGDAWHASRTASAREAAGDEPGRPGPQDAPPHARRRGAPGRRGSPSRRRSGSRAPGARRRSRRSSPPWAPGVRAVHAGRRPLVSVEDGRVLVDRALHLSIAAPALAARGRGAARRAPPLREERAARRSAAPREAPAGRPGALPRHRRRRSRGPSTSPSDPPGEWADALAEAIERRARGHGRLPRRGVRDALHRARSSRGPSSTRTATGTWPPGTWRRARSTSTGSTGSRRSSSARASSGTTRGLPSTASARATSTSSRAPSGTSRCASPARPPRWRSSSGRTGPPGPGRLGDGAARLAPGNFLLGWVLGYGGQAEVAGPPDVREQLRARVEELGAAVRRIGAEERMRLHLVDGTFELFRAHFSKRPGHGRRPTAATSRRRVGLADSLRALLRDPARGGHPRRRRLRQPHPLLPQRPLRRLQDRGGRAPRSSSPSSTTPRRPSRALGLTVWSMREFEADDALATAAARFRDQVEQVRILTPGQGPGPVPLRRRRGAGGPDPRTARSTRRRCGRGAASGRRASPTSWRWWATRPTGSPACPASARRPRRRCSGAIVHLESIPDDPALWPPGIRGAARLAAALAAGREEALLYRRLATLVRDVPLAESLEDLRAAAHPSCLAERGRQAHSHRARHRTVRRGVRPGDNDPRTCAGPPPSPADPTRPAPSPRRRPRSRPAWTARPPTCCSSSPLPTTRRTSRPSPRWPAQRHPGALLVGCTGSGVIGGAREAEEGPALSLTGAWLPGRRLQRLPRGDVVAPRPRHRRGLLARPGRARASHPSQVPPARRPLHPRRRRA